MIAVCLSPIKNCAINKGDSVNATLSGYLRSKMGFVASCPIG
jgi:predicted metal-binding transcription factor (methanogenesis marker protein 9)